MSAAVLKERKRAAASLSDALLAPKGAAAPAVVDEKDIGAPAPAPAADRRRHSLALLAALFAAGVAVPLALAAGWLIHDRETATPAPTQAEPAAALRATPPAPASADAAKSNEAGPATLAAAPGAPEPEAGAKPPGTAEQAAPTAPVVEPTVAPAEAPRTAPQEPPAAGAPAPLPPARPAHEPGAAGSGYYVQLASVGSAAAAEREAARLRRALGAALSGHTLGVADGALAGGVAVYRIRLGPLGGRDEARQLCASLKRRNQDCLVVRPPPRR